MAEGYCNGRNHFGHVMCLHNASLDEGMQPTRQQTEQVNKKMKGPSAELYQYIPQLFHTDFGEEEGSEWFPNGIGCNYSPDEVPCTALLAVSHNVQLDFSLGSWKPTEASSFMQNYPDAVVTSVGLLPGDIIIWRGDVYHRGPASTSECLRILVHVYSDKMKMVGDNLYSVFQNSTD